MMLCACAAVVALAKMGGRGRGRCAHAQGDVKSTSRTQAASTGSDALPQQQRATRSRGHILRSKHLESKAKEAALRKSVEELAALRVAVAEIERCGAEAVKRQHETEAAQRRVHDKMVQKLEREKTILKKRVEHLANDGHAAQTKLHIAEKLLAAQEEKNAALAAQTRGIIESKDAGIAALEDRVAALTTELAAERSNSAVQEMRQHEVEVVLSKQKLQSEAQAQQLAALQQTVNMLLEQQRRQARQAEQFASAPQQPSSAATIHNNQARIEANKRTIQELKQRLAAQEAQLLQRGTPGAAHFEHTQYEPKLMPGRGERRLSGGGAVARWLQPGTPALQGGSVLLLGGGMTSSDDGGGSAAPGGGGVGSMTGFGAVPDGGGRGGGDVSQLGLSFGTVQPSMETGGLPPAGSRLFGWAHAPTLEQQQPAAAEAAKEAATGVSCWNASGLLFGNSVW